MDGVMHPSVEQAIGRDRIRKAFKRYENNPADEHDRGIVRAVNSDGSYEVLLDGDVQTARCAPYAKAMVGDRVIVVTTKDGENVLLGRLGGETETIMPTIDERFEALEPVVLYDNSAGTTGTVTLSETAANFSYMEIFFMTNDAEHQSVRIASPNGKVATLSQIKPRDVDAVYLKAMNVLVSGTTITQDTTNAVSAEYNFFAGGTVGFYQRYHILVTKVVGYK